MNFDLIDTLAYEIHLNNQMKGNVIRKSVLIVINETPNISIHFKENIKAHKLE